MASSFGQSFAPQMGICQYRDGVWSEGKLQPTEALSIHPASNVLHYGGSCFEGMKAYRWADGSIHLFRPDRNFARMQASARMLCLPEPSIELLEGLIHQVVDAARELVPEFPGSLYLRPTLIGTEPNIGGAAHPSNEAILFVLASPVGDYFSGGMRPLRLLIETEHLRCAPHFGQVKTGGNYASALGQIVNARAQYQADQVLFCPGGDVQETGAANFLLFAKDRVLTSALEGAILPGVTRDSILQLAKRDGYEVQERHYDVDELLQLIPQSEAALSGTAAILTPVGTLIYQGKEHPVGDGAAGPRSQALRDQLTAIQSGLGDDTLGWMQTV